MIAIITAILLILFGLYSIFAGFMNKPCTSLVFRSDSFIARAIFKKNYDRVANFVLGAIYIFLGILIIIYS